MNETTYVMSNFIVFTQAVLVMLMAIGFCMLEVGSVRSKFISNICMKNILSFSICLLTFYFVGYNIMFYGTLGIFSVNEHIT